MRSRPGAANSTRQIRTFRDSPERAGAGDGLPVGCLGGRFAATYLGMSARYAEGDLVAAVGVWADFPVGAVPRPYVLTQPAVIEAGYRTDDAKVAFIEGRVRFGEGFPAAAVDALLVGGVRMSPGSSGLLVTNAARVRHPFRTDRGERMLPAWRMEVQDSLGPLIVLDDEPGRS
jgi:hypothetical protein